MARQNKSERSRSAVFNQLLGLSAASATLFGNTAAASTNEQDIATISQNSSAIQTPQKGGDNTVAWGIAIGAGAVLVGSAALRANKLLKQSYEDMLKDWGLEVVEAVTDEEKSEARKIRLTGAPNYNFDPQHPDNNRIRFSIIKKGPDAGVTDELDHQANTHIYLIKQKGKNIGTFRLTRANDKGERNLLIDRVFLPQQVKNINEDGGVEISFMSVSVPQILLQNGPLRLGTQLEEVLALEVSKKIVEFAHATGATQLIASTTEAGKRPFRKIHDGNEMPSVEGASREKVMGRDNLQLVSGNLRDFFAGSPQETLAIIDPNQYFSGPSHSKSK